MKNGYLNLKEMKKDDIPCRVNSVVVSPWIFLNNLVKVILKLKRKTPFVQTTEPIESFRKWCYFDDSDLVWLSEYVLHLSRDLFLSHGPCFHHLTHHSNHFNETVIMLKRVSEDQMTLQLTKHIDLDCSMPWTQETGRERRQTKAERARAQVKRAKCMC